MQLRSCGYISLVFVMQFLYCRWPFASISLHLFQDIHRYHYFLAPVFNKTVLTSTSVPTTSPQVNSFHGPYCLEIRGWKALNETAVLKTCLTTKLYVQFKHNQLSFNIERRSKLMYARLWCKFVPSQWSELIEWRETSTNVGTSIRKHDAWISYSIDIMENIGQGIDAFQNFVWSWWKICLAFTAHDRLVLCFCGLLPSTLFRVHYMWYEV